MIYDINDCKASSLGEYLPNILGLENDEKIIYMAATDSYKGFMLFAFENGKIAKIELDSYATKTNRKKLANAYSDISKLVGVMHIESDIELAAYSSIKKALVFNTSAISPKSARNSQGVQVLKSKKGSAMTAVKKLEESGIKDADYYRTKNIPAVGCYLKDEDTGIVQLKIDL